MVGTLFLTSYSFAISKPFGDRPFFNRGPV